jgi:geranylgeranyl diphosphate synthase, type II
VDTHGLLDLSERRTHLVDEVLERFFAEQRGRARRVGAAYEVLWETLERNAAGGKRFRPRMVMAAYESLGGEDLPAAARVGAAFELLHTALIVHDDVIDRDFVRRGSPNVSGSYRDIATTNGIPIPIAEHRGMSVAVIAGDLALFYAYRLLDSAALAGDVRGRVVDVLDESMFLSAAGELYDVDFSIRPGVPSVDEIVEMERLKTAMYSFEGPLQAGALLAGARDEAVSALGDFGRGIGIAYQIVDDLLGVFGEEESTGKSTLGDLREGKNTVLFAHAVTRPEWAPVAHLFGDPTLTAEQGDLLRAALEEAGSRRYAEALARDYANRAWEALASPALTDRVRDEFRPVVAGVLGRVR